jgi:hypothetical protein
MVAETTNLKCETHGEDRPVFRLLGRIVDMSRSQPVPFYETAGLKENIAAETRECGGIAEQGLVKYPACNWTGAIRFFSRAPGAGPALT